MFDVVTTKGRPDAVTLQVIGDLDIAHAPRFATSAEDALRRRPGASVTLDLSGVEFIDSTGISALMQLRSVVNDSGGTLGLDGCSSYVERVLRLVGLAELMG